MQLHVAQPPEQANVIAASSAARLLRSAQEDRFFLRERDVSELALALPHPIYTMTLADLLQRKSIDDIPDRQIVGWRYLVLDRDRAVACVEVAVKPRTSWIRFAQIQSESVARATETTLHVIQDLDISPAHAYQIRLLRVAALYAVAFWLHEEGSRGQPEERNYLAPIAPAPTGLEANHVYQTTPFFAVLHRQALDRSMSGPARSDM